MFGYIVVNQGEMKFKDYTVYRSFYCGLCRKLKEQYGLRGQITLSFDMTFLIMLLTGLYEPEIETGKVKCIAHPFEKHETRINQFTEYAADMNVLLTGLKCADDWEDERKYSRKLLGDAMRPALRRIRKKYPDKAYRMEKSLADLHMWEQQKVNDIDMMSGLFGDIMAEMFDVKADEWQAGLRRLGLFLGKFIYLMDAYEDIERDLKNNNYNPLWQKWQEPDFAAQCESILTMMMAECSREFERLPIIENAEILRNILYSGVWWRYEQVGAQRTKAK